MSRTSSGLASVRQAREIGLVRQCLLQQRVEFRTIDLDGAELLQMLGDELRIEQREAAADQPRAQIDERNLAGVPATENMLSPKKAPLSATPYSPPTSLPSAQVSTVWQ